MTNGDKFRMKTDKEIADMIFGKNATATAPPGRNCIGGCKWDSRRECWMAYLAEEAEDENGGQIARATGEDTA